jgi:hypothetical protein
MLLAEILWKAKDYRLRRIQDSGSSSSSLKSFGKQRIIGFVAYRIAAQAAPR